MEWMFSRKAQVRSSSHSVHTEWQWPLSGVHSILMEKLAQPGDSVGDKRPPLFTLSTITCKVVVYAPAERADTLPLFLLYPYMYSVPPAGFFNGLWESMYSISSHWLRYCKVSKVHIGNILLGEGIVFEVTIILSFLVPFPSIFLFVSI